MECVPYSLSSFRCLLGLLELFGRDGDMTPDVTFSKRFQAEVAAIALKESSKVLMTMPISEFTEMCAEVGVFLLRGSAEKKGLRLDNNAEELPSVLEGAEA